MSKADSTFRIIRQQDIPLPRGKVKRIDIESRKHFTRTRETPEGAKEEMCLPDRRTTTTAIGGVLEKMGFNDTIVKRIFELIVYCIVGEVYRYRFAVEVNVADEARFRKAIEESKELLLAAKSEWVICPDAKVRKRIAAHKLFPKQIPLPPGADDLERRAQQNSGSGRNANGNAASATGRGAGRPIIPAAGLMASNGMNYYHQPYHPNANPFLCHQQHPFSLHPFPIASASVHEASAYYGIPYLYPAGPSYMHAASYAASAGPSGAVGQAAVHPPSSLSGRKPASWNQSRKPKSYLSQAKSVAELGTAKSGDGQRTERYAAREGTSSAHKSEVQHLKEQRAKKAADRAFLLSKHLTSGRPTVLDDFSVQVSRTVELVGSEAEEVVMLEESENEEQSRPAGQGMSEKARGKKRAIEEVEVEEQSRPVEMSEKAKGKRRAVEDVGCEVQVSVGMSEKARGKKRAIDEVQEDDDAAPRKRRVRFTGIGD